jgi:uncharacterized protein with PQ loop repeat
MTPDLIGYASSFVLVVTIAIQIRRQWRARTNKGVSVWLFLGQFVASSGFLVYSLLIGSWPFVLTNAVLALAALVGIGVFFWTARHPESESQCTEANRATEPAHRHDIGSDVLGATP